ncbi:MAG: leucyl-tRNA synthetase [Gaiellaceae bacterium]|jgi:leucyl-tRNA synthetase|nr:leucyl-tRNA synthetase [Gaiellaceae bacterium]
MDRYDAQTVETKWQRIWDENRAFEVPNPEPGAPRNERKSYVLEMLPYPSGTLHIGHVLVYTLGDVLTHFYRRTGSDVLRPMGYDSFGLPAENAALKEGEHPRDIVERNIESIRRTMKRIGWAIDWSRELSTHDPEYYRWTQWLFLKFFEAGHTYRKAALVNWCPNDQTVLANEQVKDGRCERCGFEVEARKLEQWFFRITAYADSMLDEMKELDWPERVLAMQRNWIGRSEGAEILFRLEELDIDIPVFTTRPDTLFGATFFVLAPEHPLVDRLAEQSPNGDEIRAYVRKAGARPAEERAAGTKTGVFTGFFATNPVNDARIPIWVADYVLMDYGTGAIMAVPAHDERDEEFAARFDLPVKVVIDDDGKLVDSAQFSGMPHEEAAQAIVEWLGTRGSGASAVSYRLRDWGYSRQRYWGCPIPIVYCDDCGIVPVPEEELPVILPEVEDYKPKGIPPLAQAEDWVRVPCPQCGKEGRREVETMDTFVDSSWYFLRYCDPHNDKAPYDRELADYWMPVDHYTGGLDHSTVHLIYARYFQKVLNELGLSGHREPFKRFFGNGFVTQGGMKISKRVGGAATPDELVESYGADATRLSIMFIGPADQDMEWTPSGVEGMQRFLRRLWRVVGEVADSSPTEGSPENGALRRRGHRTIARATDDLGRRQQFHTPIAAVMELVNDLSKSPGDPAARFAAETAVSLIQPYAPHVAEELWERLGHERLWEQPWPQADPAFLEEDTFELVVQVNGKVRDRFRVPADLPEDELVARAKESPKVQAHLNGGEIRQTIVVPRKLVNLVVG